MFDFILLQSLFNLTLYIVGVIIIFSFINKIFKSIKKFKYVQNFTLYQKVLIYHMDRAYAIIYKDRLLIWSVEATKVSEPDFAKITKDYVELVIKMLGPMLYKEMMYLYGNDDTLLFTVVEYFNDKYENDEIRDASIENLQQEED